MTSTLMSIPPEGLPRFDELYVISDLHLGGLSGLQIFNSGGELSRLIDHLSLASPDKQIALVINGDFVDFLPEPDVLPAATKHSFATAH